jgi:uncharacterized membrane protein
MDVPSQLLVPLFCLIVLVIVVVPSYFIWNGGRQRTLASEKHLTDAHAAYQDALAKLKLDPSNAELKQHTLALGRYYSTLTRKQNAVTVYDELILMNDINAATTGVTAGVTAAANHVALSTKARLCELDDLRAAGLITENEYTERRRAILEQI